MEITEIRVKLTMDPRNKLKAFCSVTFDDAFVVRDLKIIEGSKGPFVAMPSRKLADRCRRCGGKNPLTAAYCSSCGTKLDPSRATRDQHGRAKLHADLAHPVNSACRIELHRAVIKAFSDEIDKSKLEDYRPASFDDLDEVGDFLDESYLQELARREEVRVRTREQAAKDSDSKVHEQGL